MKKLSRRAFKEASQAIKENARPLEKRLFDYYFYDGTEKAIIDELKKYQNKDGGFGHGLESDFRLPHSSPKATSIGIRILSKLDKLEEAQQMIKPAIGYLEESFDHKRNGWYVAPKAINNFSHAPWWHHHEVEGMTILDKDWGNPSAEIIAYLYRYKDYVRKLNVDKLVEQALDYIENKQTFISEHNGFKEKFKRTHTPDFVINYFENEECFDSRGEIFCYLKLYDVLPQEQQEVLGKRIASALIEVVEYNEEKWKAYVPMPIDFVGSPQKNNFGIKMDKLINNLVFLIKELETNGKVIPSWSVGKSYYNGSLKLAYNEWIGILTLGTLMILKNYGMIEENLLRKGITN